MNLRDTLVCGYYDEDTGKDYIAEINTDMLKKWFEQESLDLLDFESKIEKKIAVYNILEEEFKKDLGNPCVTFTVKFV